MLYPEFFCKCQKLKAKTVPEVVKHVCVVEKIKSSKKEVGCEEMA